MLKIKNLGVITDDAMNKILCSETCIVIHLDIDDLTKKRKEQIFKYFSDEYHDININIDNVMIWVEVSLTEKTFTPCLAVDFTPDGEPCETMLCDISFNKREWSDFMKEIIIPFFTRFKRKITNYD